MTARKAGDNALDEVLRGLMELDRKLLCGEVQKNDPVFQISQRLLREQRAILSRYEVPTIKATCFLCNDQVKHFGQLCPPCQKKRENEEE